MLGEVNASHTGCYGTDRKAADQTAALGLLYDLAFAGEGQKVAEVIQGGPVDKASSKIKAGDHREGRRRARGVELDFAQCSTGRRDGSPCCRSSTP